MGEKMLTTPCVKYVQTLLSAIYKEIEFTWDRGAQALTARTGKAEASLTGPEIAFRATRPVEAAELLSRRLDAAIVESFKKEAGR